MNSTEAGPEDGGFWISSALTAPSPMPLCVVASLKIVTLLRNPRILIKVKVTISCNHCHIFNGIYILLQKC